MNVHKHQSYLLEQHSELFKIWSAIIRINTEGKSLIMKLGPELFPSHSKPREANIAHTYIYTVSAKTTILIHVLYFAVTCCEIGLPCFLATLWGRWQDVSGPFSASYICLQQTRSYPCLWWRRRPLYHPPL